MKNIIINTIELMPINFTIIAMDCNNNEFNVMDTIYVNVDDVENDTLILTSIQEYIKYYNQCAYNNNIAMQMIYNVLSIIQNQTGNSIVIPDIEQ